MTSLIVFEATATDLDELTETVTSYISFCEDICIPTRTFLSFNNDKPWFTGKLKQLRQAKEDAYRSGDNELTETVTSYISFCEDICIPTRTFLSFNNDKPWFTGKLKQLRQAKEDAYRSGDKILYNQTRNRLTKEIRVAKNNYSEKLKKELSAKNDPASVWTGLRNITMYKTPPPQSVENQQLADDLNVFYCRFEKVRLTPSTRSDLHFTHSPSPPATPLPPSPTILTAFKVCVEQGSSTKTA